jgi:hypothetical protein
MNLRNALFLLFFILLAGASTVVAQPGDPGGGDPDVPLTGIEFLVGAGAFLGIRKVIGKIYKRQ